MDPECAARLGRILDPAERRRIEQLRSPSDRLRAAASRGLVRQLLAGYTGGSPADIRLHFGPTGKPEVVLPPGTAPLHFNSTHSGDVLLIAVGRVPTMGIDVERVRPVARLDRVARRAFSADERQQILSLPPDERSRAFLTCWTRKEACVKAVGSGVWSGFDRFEVSVGPREPAVLSVAGVASAAARWSLYHLEPAPGYLGALAVRGTGFRLSGGELDCQEVPT